MVSDNTHIFFFSDHLNSTLLKCSIYFPPFFLSNRRNFEWVKLDSTRKHFAYWSNYEIFNYSCWPNWLSRYLLTQAEIYVKRLAISVYFYYAFLLSFRLIFCLLTTFLFSSAYLYVYQYDLTGFSGKGPWNISIWRHLTFRGSRNLVKQERLTKTVPYSNYSWR